MVTQKIQKVLLAIILVLGYLNILATTEWEYHLFFGSKKLFIDERIEEEVNDVIKGFYKRGVPLHQIGHDSFVVYLDDCMPNNLWGIAEGTGIPDKVLVSLNTDILKSTPDFLKWVLAHEFAHELGFKHEDDVLIMRQFMGKGVYRIAMDDLCKKVLNRLENQK